MKIKKNVKLLTILPISLLLAAGLYLFWSGFTAYRLTSEQQQALQKSELSTSLYVNLLKEAGVSTLYSALPRTQIAKLLQTQRTQTDIAARAYRALFASAPLDEESSTIFEALTRLPQLRTALSSQSIDNLTFDKQIFRLCRHLLHQERHLLPTSTPALHHTIVDTLSLMLETTEEQNAGIRLLTHHKEGDKTLLELIDTDEPLQRLSASLPQNVRRDATRLLQDPAFVETNRKLQTLKKRIAKEDDSTDTSETLRWFKLQTQRLSKLNQLVDLLSSSLAQHLTHNAHIALFGMILLAGVILLSLYLLYLYTRMREHFFSTRSLERLLDKIIRNALLEDTIDLDSTEGIEKTYRIIEETVDKIEKEKKKAERANAAKSIFLANMSHEIRTPINGIIGFTDLLKNSDLGKNEREYVDIITKSTDNLLEIINNILDLSKIESKKIEIDEIIFSPQLEFESAIDVYTSNAAAKKINYSLQMSPDFEHFLIGDPTKIKEVLQNLISNALKFTPEGGQITVVIRKESPRDASKERIYFEVSDNGIGMSEEEMEDIFNAFSQADSTITRKYGGTGLGLTISYNYVSLMGGKLEVRSQKGVGSNFFFTLELPKEKPMKIHYKDRFDAIDVALVADSQEHERRLSYLKELFSYLCHDVTIVTSEEALGEALPKKSLIVAQSALLEPETRQKLETSGRPFLLICPTPDFLAKQEEQPDVAYLYEPLSFTRVVKMLESLQNHFNLRRHRPQKTVAPKGKIPKILVAEDNEINQKLMASIMKRLHLEMELASNGREAVEAVKKGAFDLILMDIAMPVMDGLSATKEILAWEREEKRTHTPIVALTANALKGDKERYLNEGMDGYLSKPAREEDIRALLQEFGLEVPAQKEEQPTQTPQKEHTIAPTTPAKEQTEQAQEPSEARTTPNAILLYKKSKVETKIFEKVLKQLYDDVEYAKNGEDLMQKVRSGRYRVVMVDKEIPDLDLNMLLESVEDRERTAILLFRAFDTIIDDQTKAAFDDVLINSADKAYLRLALEPYLDLRR